jgi:hypothetical protein
MLRELRRKRLRRWAAALIAIGSAVALIGAAGLIIAAYLGVLHKEPALPAGNEPHGQITQEQKAGDVANPHPAITYPSTRQHEPVLLPHGAISWWPGEKNAKDLVGHNDGTVEDGVSFAHGKVKWAFLFNGQENGGGINLHNAKEFRFTADSSFTLEAWVNCFGPTKGKNDGQVIIILNYPCGNTVQVLSIGNDGKAYFHIRDQGGNGSQVASQKVVEPNSWHHIAGVRQVMGTAKTLKLYVDGELVDFTNDSSTGDLTSTSPDVDLIGRRHTCGTNNTFYGLIDEPTIYDRALADNEIKRIFDAGSAGKRR